MKFRPQTQVCKMQLSLLFVNKLTPGGLPLLQSQLAAVQTGGLKQMLGVRRGYGP